MNAHPTPPEPLGVAPVSPLVHIDERLSDLAAADVRGVAIDAWLDERLNVMKEEQAHG